MNLDHEQECAEQSLAQGRFFTTETSDADLEQGLGGKGVGIEKRLFEKEAREYTEEEVTAQQAGRKIDEETVLVCDLREAFAQYWQSYWGKLGLCPVNIDGAYCYHNDLPYFTLKGVFFTQWDCFNIVQSHKEIARFFREKGGWFSWYLPVSEDSEQFRSCLYKIGLEPVLQQTGWHVGSIDYPFVKIDPKFRCVHVDDPKKLGMFMSILGEHRGYESGESGALSEMFKQAGFKSGLMHFVGFYDGSPVGVVSFVRAIDRICVYHLVVKPVWRGKGIGRLLLQEMIGFANVLKIEKTIILGDQAASGFFEKCGFCAFDEYLLYSARA